MATAASSRPRQSARSIQSVSSSVGESSSLKPSSKSSKPVSLSRRLLFPQLPPDADLPALLASPSAAPVLNAELYDCIALALRAFVNPWWTKITRYDKEFLPAITRVVTALARALEARLISTDLAPLVFRDLPTLLTQHWIDFRNAQSKLHTSYASGGAATLPQLFHQLQPHMAISANGLIDEVYVRQAVDFLLKECLPPDDYESDAERYVFREIVVKVLLSSVVPRITEPWFIHKLILDLMRPEKDALSENSDTPRHASLRLNQTPQRRALSFQSLAIFFLSAIQSFSGACLALIHAYRQTRDTIRKVNVSTTRFPHQQSPDATPDSTPRTERDVTTEAPTVASSEVPGGLKSSLSPASFTSPLTLPRLSQPPPVSAIPHDPISRSTSSASTPSAASFSGSSHAIPTHPPSPSDYTHPPLALLLTILFPPPTPLSTSSAGPGTSSRSTALALAYTLSLPLTALSPFLSRLLPYLLYTHVLSVDRVTDIVRIARRALFPEGWPIPPPVDPTPEEQTALREELGRRLLASVPGPLVVLLGPTPTARSHTIDAALAPLSSRECNAHLMLFILDLILLTVFPEMGASVSENTDAGMGGEERLP